MVQRNDLRKLYHPPINRKTLPEQNPFLTNSVLSLDPLQIELMYPGIKQVVAQQQRVKNQ